MKRRGRVQAAVPAAAAMALLIATGCGRAWAEAVEKQPPAQGEGLHRMDEVVVTATKETAALSEVAASVTVLEGEDLRGSGARVLTDALHQAAGVQMDEWEGSGEFAMVTMRGMPALNSQYVQVLVDGVARNTALDMVDWSAIPMENVERVELIKGPASALYGKNALGGVINIITKKGGAAHEGSVSAGYGSYGENKEAVNLSGPVGAASYAATLTRRAGQGWRDENNGFARYNGAARIDAHLTPATKAGVSLDASTWELEYPDYLPKAMYQAGERNKVFFKHGREAHDEQNASVNVEHALPKGLSLINRTYAQNVDEAWKDIVDVVDKALASQRLGDELRLVSHHQVFGRLNQTILGLQFEHESYDERRRYSQYFPNPAKRGQTFLDAESSRVFTSLYVHDELKLAANQVTVNTGLRYDRVGIDLDNQLDPSGSRDTDFTELSPKLGATWAVTPALTVFAGIGTGFKAPVGAHIASNPNIRAEDALSYETGLRASLPLGIYLQATLYRSRLDNQLVMVPVADKDGTFRYENAGQSTMQGLELEGDIDLGHGFMLVGSYTYNDSSYDRFADYAMDYSGHELPWQPKHKGAVELRYTHSSGWGGSLSSRLVGEQWLDNENSYQLDAYSLVDAKLRYTHGMVEGSLSVRNLLDTDYAAAGENWGDGDLYISPGDPVTLYAEVRLRL